MRVRVEVKEKYDETAVLHVSVADTGIGIPEDQLESIFDRFSQADSSTTRKYGGTGLGLAICSQLVSAMRGRIWVESTLGEGSTFHFTVPLTIGSEAAATEGAPVAETAETADLCGMRVLLAEDHPFNQAVISEVLRKVGCSVIIASNGREAVQAVQDHPFDMILMDIQMPEVDGFEATRQIRALEAGRTIPIIAQTAHAFAEDKAEALAAGMDDYVSKPLRPAALRACVQRLARPAGRVSASGPPVSQPGDSGSSDAASAHVDLGVLLERLGGDEQALTEVVDMFFKETPMLVSHAELAADSGDWDGLATISHSLRGSCATFGARELAIIAEQMEQAAREHAGEQVAALLPSMREELSVIDCRCAELGVRPGPTGGTSHQ